MQSSDDEILSLHNEGVNEESTTTKDRDNSNLILSAIETQSS